ncbi:Stp1/IreP family PP2C-type Ser/Thr phosphatase [Caldanaerobius polysaccharolyticus]|uniref:Stp1/IreP family PP2C-type Ser/Thr phosphatase n=1 Tax=Caldanaerobius polysaccharolyticus TaxID=44256 RepID=UPI00047EA110|nr:Stp1/IreP family PP2C-type Ser/Thr phosphatase [Caldanaerobius polysaccharolyticus]
MKAVGKTDVGNTRENNEDGYYIKNDDELKLFIVADGMGGHNAGEIASSLAIKSVADYFEENYKKINKRDCDIVNFIKEAIVQGNLEVFKRAMLNKSMNGMGTTLTLLLIENGKYFLGHIGDSRAYLVRDGEIKQISNDHSLVAELIRQGSITENEARVHPQRNIITRALGTEDDIEIDIAFDHVNPGDIILLCTDGLTSMLTDQEILDIIYDKEPEMACEELVKAANARGGYDNITVVITKVES